jgi:GDP-L-fucose synthase
VAVWGSGRPRREFMHVDDMAAACVHVMKMDSFRGMVNVGSGEEVSIRELAETICDVVGYKGSLTFDATKPDGTPRKLLDVSLLKSLGWHGARHLRDGIASTYDWFANSQRA